MRKLYLFILINLLLFNNGFSIEIKKLQYDASHYKQIESMYIILKGELSTNLNDYFYSLNSEHYTRFNKIDINFSDTYIYIYNLNLEAGINTLKVVYNGNEVVDTSIVFMSPVLDLTSVSQGNMPLSTIDNNFIVRNNQPVKIEFKYNFPASTFESVYGPAAINSVNYYLDEWKSSEQSELIINNINYGINNLLIQPVNNKGDTYQADRLIFFYADFELPVSIWKTDTLIKLTGHPEGGWFTGDGIVGNSNYFNPALAKIGNNQIVYRYPLFNSEATVEKNIEVIYNFSIEGELSLCRNSTDVKYSIPDFSEDFEFIWEIKGGKFQDPESDSQEKFVDWDRELPEDENFGAIKVTAKYKLSDAIFIREIKVLLNKNIAYDKPNLFFGDNEKRLLVCDNTEAYKYLWSKDGSANDETVSPFYYFDGPGIKYNVTLVTQEGCKTNQDILASTGQPEKNSFIEGHESSVLNFDMLSKEMSIYPNPVKNNISVLLGNAEKSNIVRILNINSQIVFETKMDRGVLFKQFDIKQLPPGQYIIQVSDNQESLAQQFMKIK